MNRTLSEFALRLMSELVKEDAEVDFRIKTGTEMYRKGFARFELRNQKNGKPLSGAKIKVRQTKHEFLFGCNAFLYHQFPEAEQNCAYTETFTRVFNEAVIPFYWSDLEPADGAPRFESGSVPCYRRPPTDDLLAFCRQNGIVPKGHPLCWHCFMPDWAPCDYTEMMRRLDRRIREIADRYGNDIFLWDAVNEAQTRNPLTREDNPAFPDDYVERVFQMAARYLPNAALLYNDNRKWWDLQGDYSPVYLLARHLLDRGCRLGGLGFQFHLFDQFLHEGGEYRCFLNPRFLFRILDQYAKLALPLNISEVSIVGRRDLGDGDAFQEFVFDRLYRLWFSHPAVNSIVWWNLVDGTAAYAPLGSEDGENSLRAGLVNYDFTPKPAYRVLDNLVNREWRTNASFDYVDGAENMFHGFYGEYDVEISSDSGTLTKHIVFHKDALHTFRFTV